MISDCDSYDALGLAELVRSGQVTPLVLVDEAIKRIEASNPAINAVIYKMYEQARVAAQGTLPDGPFCGVSFLVKDLGAMVAGVPQSSGTRLLKKWVPPVDGELVRRWKAAGLIILGKTNTPELGITPYTEPLAFGPTRNPYHWTPAGLPVGIQFADRFGDEATIFRLAGQLEQAQPWAGHKPKPAAEVNHETREAIG